MQHMTKPNRLLITRILPEPVMTRAARNYELTVNDDDLPYSPEELAAALIGQDGALVSLTEKCDAQLIAGAPETLRILATYSVGVDHIDIDAARRRGLIVTNTPDVLTDATAEIAVLLTLAAARRAGEGERMVREGRWQRWSPTGFLGTGLVGKQVGILGLGRIGRAIAARLKPFGVDLHYHSRNPVDAPEISALTYHPSSLDLFSACDVVIIAAAATAQTRHIVNAAAIDALGPQGVLVNVSRGDLVDEDALISALTDGRLAAAGLDVFQGEPNIDERWRTIRNVFLLPHLGSATIETRIAMGMRALDNLDQFFAGGEPADRVA